MTYPRRILLAITGLSPQVLSETLYGLSFGQNREETPNELHVVTTATGVRRLREVFGEADVILEALSRQSGGPPFRLPLSNIHVPTGGKGIALDDISTAEENLAYADAVTALLRQFTADPRSQLHVSIAGGRKTMGFLLGYAFTLFARPQDRLSHVLVSEPFERVPGFLHPTSEPNWLELPGGSPVNAQLARVSLVEIPYVSLRGGIPAALLEGRASYEQVVAAARRGLEAPRLVLRLATREVEAAGHRFRLPPLEMALYSLLARRTRAGEPALSSPEHRDAYKLWGALIANELGRMARLPAARDSVREPADTAEARYEMKKRVYENLSRLKRRLGEQLGIDAPAYLVHDNNTRPRLYSLRLPAGAIEID